MSNIYRTIQIRVSEYEWVKFKELKEKGFSPRHVVEIISNCEPCTGLKIIVFDKDGTSVTIPRNIFKSKR